MEYKASIAMNISQNIMKYTSTSYLFDKNCCMIVANEFFKSFDFIITKEVIHLSHLFNSYLLGFMSGMAFIEIKLDMKKDVFLDYVIKCIMEKDSKSSDTQRKDSKLFNQVAINPKGPREGNDHRQRRDIQPQRPVVQPKVQDVQPVPPQIPVDNSQGYNKPSHQVSQVVQVQPVPPQIPVEGQVYYGPQLQKFGKRKKHLGQRQNAGIVSENEYFGY